MNEMELKKALTSVTPEVPEQFHLRMEQTLESIVAQEAQMKNSTKKAIRFSARTVVLAAALAVMMCAVALAATQWHLFDSLSFMTGKETPVNAGLVMQSDLYQDTVNNVEIRVREAGYDGRTLLVQYSYRMLDETEAYGIRAGDVFGDELPEGMTADTIVEGISDAALEALDKHSVGWNYDQLWIDGKGIDMPGNSGGVYQGSTVPGEIIYTEYWRIDNANVSMSGPTKITLPIGGYVSAEEKKALFDRESGMYRLTDKGTLTFVYDAKDVLSQVKVITDGEEKVLPEVTAKVKEAAFTPLMTYITLELKVNPDAMKAFIEEMGEGYKDDEENLMWSYGGMDVFEAWVCSLELVDGKGTLVFPGHAGQNGYGNEWAEFLYPYMESVPDELYLAPMEDGKADMTKAVAVKTMNR
ncbi:MAG: hypothetical protein IJ229_01740 [Clostridia bacterium]|nr:hypothetical protein [Clostridia bacterium]MBR1686416.1 hypothetical protein [Clostridia bacterium]